MVSVKLPDLTSLGQNATIKIDDIDFNKTNEGVWCITKDKLIDNAKFTDWAQYKDDKIINPEETK